MRMNDYIITKDSLLFTLPPALKRDESTEALAEAAAERLADRVPEVDRLRIICNIDELEEPLLAILARDFKVDWWDPNYTLEEKRRTVKSSWRVHKKLGTKAAVETAIRAIYPLTQVEEWFDYGGEPYHFRLNIDITSDSGDRERQKRVLERLNYYKSLRSHNDGVRYFLAPEKSWAVAGGAFVGTRQVERATVPIPYDKLKKPGGATELTACGALAGIRQRMEVAVPAPELTKPGGSTTVSVGGGFTGMRQRMDATVAVPELTKPGGTAERVAAGGFVGSVARVGLRLNTDRVQRPTGKGVRAVSAGAFHSYQRMKITIQIPETIRR